MLSKHLLSCCTANNAQFFCRGIVRNDSFFDKLVFKKIQNALGGRVKLMITGSAPISETVLRFARAALGCIVIEGYGWFSFFFFVRIHFVVLIYFKFLEIFFIHCLFKGKRSVSPHAL